MSHNAFAMSRIDIIRCSYGSDKCGGAPVGRISVEEELNKIGN